MTGIWILAFFHILIGIESIYIYQERSLHHVFAFLYVVAAAVLLVNAGLMLRLRPWSWWVLVLSHLVLVLIEITFIAVAVFFSITSDLSNLRGDIGWEGFAVIPLTFLVATMFALTTITLFVVCKKYGFELYSLKESVNSLNYSKSLSSVIRKSGIWITIPISVLILILLSGIFGFHWTHYLPLS